MSYWYTQQDHDQNAKSGSNSGCQWRQENKKALKGYYKQVPEITSPPFAQLVQSAVTG
jgi:hypothetical protein